MPDIFPRPSSVNVYTVQLAQGLTFDAWHELTETCRRLGVSTYSQPSAPITWDVFVREEDKDLLE